MNIFESLLTTFEESIVLLGSLGSNDNWLEAKNQANLA